MKKIMLTGLKKLDTMEEQRPEPGDKERCLKVLFCAVCRTDAKMWSQGHRDLSLPRVLGHELVGEDETGNRFAVWPGKSCGSCRHCINGSENLCDAMEITGFHRDGGFAEHLLVPENSLVPLPENLPARIACFAEPVACVINAVKKMGLKPDDRILIYGGGSVGLMAALVLKSMAMLPLIIEKNPEKIAALKNFLNFTGIRCMNDTVASRFDGVINACPDPVAFSLGLVKIGKGGKFSFFSGLAKNQEIETNAINLLHYKEVSLIGAYGHTKEDMVNALPFLDKNQDALELLIEGVILPEELPAVMPKVLSGEVLKFIIDFTGNNIWPVFDPPGSGTLKKEAPDAEIPLLNSLTGNGNDRRRFNLVLQSIQPVDRTILASAQRKMDNKTKPLGALGKLEDLALQMSLIQNSLTPGLDRKALFVFAADHGITEEGVSAFPSKVTAQMVTNFLNGGAAINVLCRHHNIDLKIVDMGVNAKLAGHRDLLEKKVRKGTRNFAIQDAMTGQEVYTALANGMDVFLKADHQKKIQIVGLGEMGIGNTTSASAIISTITGISPDRATGRGTGIDNKGLEHKAKIIHKALDFHRPDPKNGIEILKKIGGYEIAGITGAVLGAASRGTAVVLDGVISTAAGLVAHVINPDVQGYLIAGHKSVEIAQRAALSHMELTPLIDFNMRLGEGTGAALAMDAVESACRIMEEMASFDEAGVSGKE